MKRSRTIKTCVLFTGLAISLASLPRMLEQIDAARAGTGGFGGITGIEGVPPGGLDPDALVRFGGGSAGAASDPADLALVNAEGMDAASAQQVLETARRARGTTDPRTAPARVLGPDD